MICKIKEEIDELEESFEHKDKTLEEFGDILFSVINLSRHLDIDPETAIEYANKKFHSKIRSQLKPIRRNIKT